jgi:hypothetical protein
MLVSELLEELLEVALLAEFLKARDEGHIRIGACAADALNHIFYSNYRNYINKRV